MRIIPKRGLNIGTGAAPVHAPAGVAVEVPDALGHELIGFDVAERAPVEPAARAELTAPKPREAATAARATENAAVPHAPTRKRRA